MKFTLKWLKNHLETSASLEHIVGKLTALGLEVEGVEDRAATFAPFFVAYVEKAEKHPDADRLKVCTIDTGSKERGGKVQVVCGAPNAHTGMKGVFAPEGSMIPGTGVMLKKGNIRGQDSCGMLVSEREMGLSDNHEGIIEVADDVPLGTPFAALYGLDDPVIDIALTPNRPDCAGIRGIARDLAAAGLGMLKPLEAGPDRGGFPSAIGVDLQQDGGMATSCPLFLGRLVRNVKNGPSPQWLQDRLKAVGLRPISALVDITNYLSLDLCRPLHVFDADLVKGSLRVRLAEKGEQLEALNDKTYALDDFMTVICDDNGVLSLGGVMGGKGTGCSDATTNVFIECAYFEPGPTARTGRALQIESDARYRFERGIDPAFTIEGMDMATKLVLELCGGEASAVVQAGAVPDWQRSIPFDTGHVAKLAGFDVPAERQKDILQALGFSVADDWTVQPPSWRGDIDGVADLVEEIVRVTGFDQIPAVSLSKAVAITKSADTVNFARSRKARGVLASRGMDECVTWSFMPSAKAELFGANDNRGLRLRNPISADLDQMRPSLLSNLIEAAVQNRARGFGDCALFEIGPAFVSAKPNGHQLVAAGVRAGKKAGRHWTGADASRDADIYDVKADAFAVLAACGGPSDSAQITRDAPSWYHPGRSGVLRLGANILARFGEIHPGVLDTLGIKDRLLAFEVFIDAIPQPKRKPAVARPLLAVSPFQPVSRDFAFIVDATIEADTVVRAAKGADKTFIDRVELFDIYAGKGVEPGKKSVAIAVTIQPRDQTLTDKDLESLSEKIIGQVVGKTGGQLRG